MAHEASVDSVDVVTDGGVADSGAGPRPPRTGRTSRAPRPLRAWRNAVFAVFFLSGLSMASWVARIPAVRDFNELTTQGVGLVILAGSIASVVGLVVAPLVLGRFGPRFGMASTLVVVAVGLVSIGIGSSVVPSVPLVVIGLALFGFGNGAVDVIMNVDAAEAEREIGRTVMPLMHAFFSFGTVAGAAVAAAASALGIAVAPHLAAVAVVMVVAVLVAVRFVPLPDGRGASKMPDATTAAAASAPHPTLGARIRANLAVWADLRLLAIGLVMLGMAFAEGSANDWLTLAVVDGHHFDETTAATIFTVFTIAMTASRVIGGPVLDRFGRVPVIRTLAVVGAIGLGLFIFGTETWMLVVGTILWGVGCSLGFPVGMSAAADVPDRAQSAARVSAVAMIGYCAFLVGPPLLGFLGQHFGILNALLVLLGLLVVAGLAAPSVRERAPRAV